MIPETRYARTTDRTHVAYKVSGDGPIDILLMRAWSSNTENEWREPVLSGILRRLGAIGRVVHLDRRGTGLSDRIEPGVTPTIEQRVDDMRAVLDAIGSERVVLLGLAHATALCSVFAATYPERTAGLIAWSPPWGLLGRDDQALVSGYAERVRTQWGTLEHAADIVKAVAPSRIADADFVEWIRRDQLESGTVDDAVAQWNMVSETNVDDILPSVHVPTLVLWRSGSELASRYFADRIPNATAIELPGEDHAFISGDWRAALAEMESFIERVAGLEIETDRVLATVLFSDIVESTRMADALGDRGWHDLLERHHGIVRRELARHRGREVDTAGDGFFAAFDGPARAIRCAERMREGLRDLGLEVRVGLHAGECERAGPALRGVAVHIGARIQSLAAPGEILASSTVRDLVAGSGIGFEDAGMRQLKGVPEPWHLYRVTSV
ncbi:MAG TPA: adenylate/guanylate cyclase domain-containing protein [Candidatus Limnocylindria bacterium]|nr:adenylate/guanylate cyclase domain-containing protein [Candidatus Limnocylindria bacterium]